MYECSSNRLAVLASYGCSKPPASSILMFMDAFVRQLKNDYPAICFATAPSFYWSPKNSTVYYNTTKNNKAAKWALLHELSHGILQHKTYRTDFELLQLEVAAWEKAKELAKNYSLVIHNDHIQDCLDTYRDWLHARSTCPACSEHGLQDLHNTYTCINCNTSWKVSNERFCRPYRKTV